MEYRIDCAGVSSAQDLHRILAETLCFPDWYGSNLDALYDCLTDLSVETHLILSSWTDTEPFARGFHRTMDDAQQDNPNFTVTYE